MYLFILDDFYKFNVNFFLILTFILFLTGLIKYNKFLKKYIYCKYDIFLTIKLKLFYKFLNFLNINNMRKKETIFILKKKKIHIP